ncbi:RnfH family protein [Lysobacter sp. 5GHs7-4]|uniref:RnfH family protein n=1 Tax=Lysobacter sp. 5GHs7-4 TaxID=2904253 RepID=UPI001E2EF26E|nr:RnfH family protein [Lysobacter sp. 5GHs7-4]UHQ21563.1 RnfH family protein [Lysobacter sp. 5GHs7-4]
MKIELVRAWPRRFETLTLDLPDGARLRDALALAGWDDDAEAVAYAVYGVRAEPDAALRDGDRIELLRPLLADPKDARRRRAQARGPLKGGASK